MKKLVVVAVAAAVGAISVGGAVAGHSWGGYHWARTANPFTITLGDNVTSQWDGVLRGAASDWTVSKVLDATVVPGRVSNPKRCSPPSGQVAVCNATYGNNGWLGIASISLSGSHITSGYVKLNDTYFNTSTYNTPAWRALVTCQEVGHTFGLDHQDENFSNANLGTCMDYTNAPSSNQHPNAHDYEELEIIYGHLDSSTTVSGGTTTLPGRAVPFSQASRANGSVYVDRTPDGLQITHVFWAPFGD